MRGPFEFIGDLYDYHFNYYRWFIHRRLIFSDLSWEQLYKDTRFNIFRNNDADNVGPLIQKTTLLGFFTGVGIAPLKFAMMREINKIPTKKCIPVMAGIVVVGS